MPQRRQILLQWRQCDKSRCSLEHFVLFLSASQNPSRFGTFSTQRHIAENLVNTLRKCLSQFTWPLESGKVSVRTRVHLLRGSLWCKRFMSWLFFIWFSRKKSMAACFQYWNKCWKKTLWGNSNSQSRNQTRNCGRGDQSFIFSFLKTLFLRSPA